MKYSRTEKPKMPKEAGQPESLRKALEMARDERSRIQAFATAGALAAGLKKTVNKVKHK
jgi:hypothetical protein